MTTESTAVPTHISTHFHPWRPKCKLRPTAMWRSSHDHRAQIQVQTKPNARVAISPNLVCFLETNMKSWWFFKWSSSPPYISLPLSLALFLPLYPSQGLFVVLWFWCGFCFVGFYHFRLWLEILSNQSVRKGV